MQIRYRPRRGGQLVPDYVCPDRGRGYAEPLCQSILGAEIDATVGQLLVEAVTPMALELALAVQHEIQARLDEAARLRHRQVERAQYDADRARHRYMQVQRTADRVAVDLTAAVCRLRMPLGRAGGIGARGGPSCPLCHRAPGAAGGRLWQVTSR